MKKRKTFRLANWKKQHHTQSYQNPLCKNLSYDLKPTQVEEVQVEIQIVMVIQPVLVIEKEL